MAKGKCQRAHISRAHTLCRRRFAARCVFALLCSEKEGTQHRREREGHDGRSDKSDDERHPERPQKTPFYSREEKERQESRDNYQGRIENGGADLGRRVIHDLKRGTALRRREVAVLLEPLVDVLDIHDCVVHKTPDCNGYASEHHRVDAVTHQVENKHRDNDRKGDGNDGNHRRAQVHEKEKEDYDDEKGTLEKRTLKIRHRRVYKITLPENIAFEFHVRREGGRYVGKLGVNVFGQRKRALLGLLGDGHKHGGTPFDRSNTRLRTTPVDFDGGYIAEGDNLARSGVRPHDGFCNFAGVRGIDARFYYVFITEVVYYPAAGIAVDRLGRSHDIREGHAVLEHTPRIGFNLIFGSISANHTHLRHSAEGEQTRPHDRIGQTPQAEHTRRICRKPHNHHLSENRRLRAHHGLGHARRKGFGHALKALGHYLTRTVDVCAPVEFNPHDRKSRCRRRAHTTHAVRTVDSRFHRISHDVLDFLGRKARRLGHDNDGRGIQIRKNIDVHARERHNAGHQEHTRKTDNGHAVAQRKSNYLIQHIGEA